MDVVFKEGMLYLQGAKFGKRTWRKIWMALFKASSTGVGRLEFCSAADSNPESKRVGRQKSSERKVVRLSDCLSVTFAPKASCPAGCTAFHLITTQCTYTLASSSSQDWLNALCILAFQKDPGESDKGSFEEGTSFIMEDNDIYSSWRSDSTLPPNHYHVTVLSTEASKRCKLSGDYLVSPHREGMMLLAADASRVVYRWPYRLLRKFGQVEEGFCIEAGRRCESGEGVFTFQTRHGPEIFQAISKHCSVDGRPASVHRGSSSASSPLDFPAHRPAGPPSYDPADASAEAGDDPACHYSTIDDASAKSAKPLSLVNLHLPCSSEATEDEDEDEEELCYSLESLDQDDMEDSIYYNLRRATPPTMRRESLRAETDAPECIYSDVRRGDSPSIPQRQPSPSPLTPPMHRSAPHLLSKPQTPQPPPVDDSVQTVGSAPALAEDDTEEATGSAAGVAPTEAPGSFKHRLAEIISKDLAKFQPPLPNRAGSSTFFP
ncbi:docking protein 3 [Salarias fasciatus]|uniref:docking protein 3 n=1 Tax=Salarias fasciatus TaxID=181472 RepID=UPI0011768E30|nr:docking protein 3 [Salarias fasciatus]